MNQQTEPMTNQEAQQALKSIADVKLDAVKSIRPPMLLIFLISMSYATINLGYGMTEHDNLWALAMWGGAAGFILFVGLYIYTYKLLGVKVSIIPRSKSSHTMNLIVAIIFAVLVFSGREFREMGFAYAPHLSSLLSFLVMFVMQTKYPMGEYITGDDGNEQSTKGQQDNE